ncbi:ribonuclease H1-like isoform X2 [Daphnia pulex]|uniref:ribonuclease H1-like isoform X2 n=1 Tax=Daphnia pulex TaxID=6669 RepID=UPI001EE04722|nr:ribonuclease H1-like isoform X2 [Daphnia pulex]
MTTFYAVVKGRKTGLFHTWEECESHVENFAGAHFQKFDSQEKAETFLKDSLLVDTKKNLYVVARGKIPGPTPKSNWLEHPETSTRKLTTWKMLSCSTTTIATSDILLC